MSKTRLVKSVVLMCAAFAVALPGCTSDQTDGGVGGVELEVTLSTPPAGPDESIFSMHVELWCEGTDPVTGVPRPPSDDPEEFDINLATTEGNNPLDPKNTTGLFQKEGLPSGRCHATLTAESEGMTDGAPNVTCEDEIWFDIVAGVTGQDNQVTAILSCITQARYGGVRVDGTFNQCAEHRQVLFSPTTQSAGNLVDVRFEAYDPDLGDTIEVKVTSDCGPVTDPLQTAPNCLVTDLMSPPQVCPSVATTVQCDGASSCSITVSMSDDGFDADGCDGTNAGASATAAINCMAAADCGNGSIDQGEECDPPSNPADEANASGDWCDGNCQLVDPCNPTDRFCDGPVENNPPLNPQCADTTCDVSGQPGNPGETPNCGFNFNGNETSCDLLGIGDGQCSETDPGTCETVPDCTANTQNDPLCTGGNQCTENNCNADGICEYPQLNDDTPCDGIAGTCQVGMCENRCDFDPGTGNPVTCTPNTDECMSNVCDRADGICKAEDDEINNTPTSDCTQSDTNPGFCDGAGTCQECNVTTQCGANEACVSNVCESTVNQFSYDLTTSIFKAYNSLLGVNTDPGTCVGGVWDGSGPPTLFGRCQFDTDCPGDAGGAACNAGGDACTCVDGTVCDSNDQGVGDTCTCADGEVCDEAAGGECPVDGQTCTTGVGDTCTCADGEVCDEAAGGECPVDGQTCTGGTCDAGFDGICDAGFPGECPIDGQTCTNDLCDPVECIGVQTCTNDVCDPVAAGTCDIANGTAADDCVVPDMTVKPGANLTGLLTKCTIVLGDPDINGSLVVTETTTADVWDVDMTQNLLFTIELQIPFGPIVANALITTDSTTVIDGTADGTVPGTLILRDLAAPDDAFNVNAAATGNVNCCASSFDPPVCDNPVGGDLGGSLCPAIPPLGPGDNPLPLLGDPGARLFPPMTLNGTWQFGDGAANINGYYIVNPPPLAGAGTQFAALSGVQQ